MAVIACVSGYRCNVLRCMSFFKCSSRLAEISRHLTGKQILEIYGTSSMLCKRSELQHGSQLIGVDAHYIDILLTSLHQHTQRKL